MREITQPWIRRLRVPALVFLAAFALFMANGRELSCTDTLPARYLPLRLLEGRLDLDPIPFFAATPKAYYLAPARGKLYSTYPVATAALATPFYAAAAALGRVRDDADLDRIAKLSAALLVALGVAALSAARLPHAPLAAVLLACATPVWPIASQGLWTHTGATPALCFALALATHGRALGAGLCAGIAIAARPQLGPAVAVFGLVGYLAAGPRDGRGLVRFALGAAIPFAAFVAHDVLLFGRPLGAYATAQKRLFGGDLLEGVAGLLASPSRGLICFAPWLLLGVIEALRAWGPGRAEPAARWSRACALAFGPIVLIHALHDDWWAGWSYGPRYLTEGCVLLAPLAAGGLVRAFNWQTLRPLGATCAVALVGWSIAAQAIGAFCFLPPVWNERPVDVNDAPARCFALRGSQIPVTLLAGLAPRGYPGHEASFVVAERFYARGELGPAAELAEHGLDVNPRSAPCLTLLGEVARLRGHRAEARARFEAALIADPGYPVARQALEALGARPE